MLGAPLWVELPFSRRRHHGIHLDERGQGRLQTFAGGSSSRSGFEPLIWQSTSLFSAFRLSDFEDYVPSAEPFQNQDPSPLSIAPVPTHTQPSGLHPDYSLRRLRSLAPRNGLRLLTRWT